MARVAASRRIYSSGGVGRLTGVPGTTKAASSTGAAVGTDGPSVPMGRTALALAGIAKGRKGLDERGVVAQLLRPRSVSRSRCTTIAAAGSIATTHTFTGSVYGEV